MMRLKTYFLLLVSIFFFACSGNDVFASQELSNLDASVGVNPVFTITASPSTLNFGNVDPGTATAAKDLYVSCVTNNNKKGLS